MDAGEIVVAALRRFAGEGRDSVLLGGGFERVERIVKYMVGADARPTLFLELPLAGEPTLDMHLGFDKRSLRLGPAVLECWPQLGDVIDWAEAEGRTRDLLFALDATAMDQATISGVYL